MYHTFKGKVFTDIVLEIFKLSGILAVEEEVLTKEESVGTAGWKILGAIMLSDIPLTVPHIARKMGQTRQGVQRLTNIMEKAGLLDFQDNPNHKRAKLIAITNKGKANVERLEKKQIPWANSAPETISEEDLTVTISVLRQLTHLFESKKTRS